MSVSKIRPTRYAHIEGHTNICYTKDGRVVTAGLDGDIRIFKNLDDDDCISHTVAEEVHCILMKENNIIVGTNLNIVHSYLFKEMQLDGIITRCTACPTHIDASKDGNFVAVASSDMTAKIHDCVNYKDLVFSGHSAPLLSVALDPKQDFLATASCDGTVKLWNIHTQTIVRSFTLLPTSNDLAFSPTLCRLCWSLCGKYLFVPVKSEVLVYNRDTWKVNFTLGHSTITSNISVTALSPCGKFIAAGCDNGAIAIWDWERRECVVSEKPNDTSAICGLAWHPSGKPEIAFVNKGGEFGTMEYFVLGPGLPSSTGRESDVPQSRAEGGAVNQTEEEPPNLGEMDDGGVSLARIKADMGFADDELGTFMGVPEARLENPVASSPRPWSPVAPSTSAAVGPSIALPEPQKPFQPGMSPENLSDRYMVWNNVGIVRQYQTEEENSVEVEFHDSNVHHSLHLNNHSGYSMAALSTEALVLAAEAQEDQQPSHLTVHHFSSWDGNKEWRVDMADGEDILAVCMGTGWLAVATDLRFLRIFSTSGIQRDVLCLPGRVVAMAGYEKTILVAFHSGIGVLGDQQMSSMIFNVDQERGRVVPSRTEPLPLSPKSFLAWLGFTDEGTPVLFDSAGVVKVHNRTFGSIWSPVLDTRMHVKGKSDHYFVVGASELQAAVRCILCKGCRYPPIVPRPHLSLLPFKIPLCHPEREKTTLEENFIRSKYLLSSVDHLSNLGFDIDTSREDSYSALKEAMIKLFALACRCDRDFQAVEICELMPDTDMVGIAVKYAAKLHRMQLAEKLNDVASRKAEALVSNQFDEDALGHFEPQLRNGHATDEVYSLEREESTQSSSKMIGESPSFESNPLLAVSSLSTPPANFFAGGERSYVTPNTRNPFRKNSTSSSTSEAKGLRALEENKKGSLSQSPFQPSISRPTFSKPTREKNAKTKENIRPVQSDCNKPTTMTSESRVGVPQPLKRVSALKLWMEDNRETLKKDFPDASDVQLLVEAAHVFKGLSDDVKEVYKNKAAESATVNKSIETKLEDDGKRKPSNDLHDSEDVPSKRPKVVQQKLAKFALDKK